MKIILASSSPNRQEIFQIAQIPITIIPANVDEKSIQETNLKQKALKIAELKADAISQKSHLNSVIIAGDGFNVCKNKILEKPKNIDEGRQMLKMLSNNLTIFYSALVMTNTKTQEKYKTVVSTKCWFRDIEGEIEDYLQSIDVTKYAAAYTPLNSKAITFIKRVEGSLSGFSHSVPMDLVVPKLREWKVIK